MTFPTLKVEAAIAGTATGGTNLFLNSATAGKLDTGTLATDAWVDITAYFYTIEIHRGSSRYNAPTIRYDPSTAVITLDNRDGRFDPTNLTGPYVAAGVSQIAPMKGVRVTATYKGVDYVLFTGYADSWLVAYPDGGDSACTLQATDGQKVLANFNGPAVAAVGAGETTGARINRILDNAQWPAADRLVQAGSTTVQSTTLAQSAWAEILLTADTENGQAYIDGAGRVVFRSRSDVANNPRSATVQVTFGDGATGEVDYEVINVAYDDSQLANMVRSARVGGVEQINQDTASQGAYMVRTYQRTDLIMQTDTEANYWGGFLLYQNSQPEMRATDVTVRPADSAGFIACLGSDMGDRVQVIRRPLARNGDAFTQQCFVRGVTHTISVNDWLTTLVFQSATKWAFFTLNDSTLGVLDSNALTY